MPTPRKQNESIEKYHSRLRAEAEKQRRALRGRVIHVSCVLTDPLGGYLPGGAMVKQQIHGTFRRENPKPKGTKAEKKLARKARTLRRLEAAGEIR